jgi:hypothetical protein
MAALSLLRFDVCDSGTTPRNLFRPRDVGTDRILASWTKAKAQRPTQADREPSTTGVQASNGSAHLKPNERPSFWAAAGRT